jgi:hypothetical protein
MMVRSEPIRTYIEIAVAIGCFVGAVSVGIDLLTDPERREVGALVASLGGFFLMAISLWTRYAKKPPTS